MSKWYIQPNEADPKFGVRIDTNDVNDQWKYFFTGIDIEDYPQMISCVISEIGYGGNFVGITFQGDLDPGDPPLPDDTVAISHDDFGTVFFSKKDFYQVLFDFSQKLLELNPDDTITAKWSVDMKNAINRLIEKMKGEGA